MERGSNIHAVHISQLGITLRLEMCCSMKGKATNSNHDTDQECGLGCSSQSTEILENVRRVSDDVSRIGMHSSKKGYRIESSTM